MAAGTRPGRAATGAALLVGVVLAVAGGFLAPRPAAAIDQCASAYCATLQIVEMGGTGTGRITSDPAGIDCTESPSGFSGTCFYQFVWSYVVSSIYVDMTISADIHSYVCIGSSCSAVGGSLGTSVALSPGDAATMSPEFHLGVKHTVTLSLSGTGTGRATTTPAGLDCREANGVSSGVCTFDYYFLPTSFQQVKLHLQPAAGSYACMDNLCATPGALDDITLGLSNPSSTFKFEFWIAVPLTVTVTGKGSVVSTPAAISCPSTCSKWLPPAGAPPAPWVLTATPADGWIVKDWTGACDAATGTTCDYFSHFSGGNVGVVFASTATPKPSAPPTPRPTAGPRSTASSPPTGSGPTAAPSSGAASGSPNPDVPPSDSAQSASASVPAVGVGDSPAASLDASSTASTGASAPVPAAGSATGGLDPRLLVIAALVLVAAAVLGVVLGRQGRRTKPPA